jgi:hypothetical protein
MPLGEWLRTQEGLCRETTKSGRRGPCGVRGNYSLQAKTQARPLQRLLQLPHFQPSIDHDDLEVAQLRIGTTPFKELREVSLVVLKAEPFQLVEG